MTKQKADSTDKQDKEKPKFRIKGIGDLKPKVLAAIATTIYLHETEIDEGNKLIVTLNRTSGIKMWKAISSMPNTAYYTSRRNK